jgi:ADP-ribose pyrophosphatase YjhB (NUDIX family)
MRIEMQTRIGVYGLLYNELNEILLCKSRWQDETFYNFPGGGVEENESLDDALHREMQEELHIEVVNTGLLYATNGVFHNRSGARKINVYFSIDCTPNHCPQIGDIIHFQYFSLDHLPWDEMLSIDKEFIKNLRNNKK